MADLEDYTANQQRVSRWMNNLEDDTEANDSDSDTSEELNLEEERDSITEWGRVISTNGRSRISATEAKDYVLMPIYPKTSASGVVHFVHYPKALISIDAGKEEALRVIQYEMSKVQFSIKRIGKVSETRVHALGSGRDKSLYKAWHATYRCSGIYHCQYAHTDILRICPAYDDVSIDDLYSLTQEAGRKIQTSSVFQRTRVFTEAKYNAFIANWQGIEGPCRFPGSNERTCHGRLPKVFERNQVQFAGCPLNSDTEPWHTAESIPPMTSRVDIEYYKALFELRGIQPQKSNCIFIGHAKTKREKCGYDHPQGQGRVQHYTGCIAKFDVYLPRNMSRFPYIIIVSSGNHSHHPPYPTRLPQEIADDFTNWLKEVNILSLTRSRFSLSPIYQRIINKWAGITTHRALYDALNIQDVITAFIRRERLIQFPEGTHIQGVIREFHLDREKHREDQWIRAVEYSSNDFFIVLCTSKMAKAMLDCIHLEIDMSFKMVAGTTNLFSLVGWDVYAKAITPFCYVLTNTTSRKGYAKMFSLIFEVLDHAANARIRFSYLDQTENGIRTIGLDMCKKQAPGLGDFLARRDPSRTWEEHLQYILVFCQVHLKRNLLKKYKNHPGTHTIIPQIFQSESRAELALNVRSICGAYPELKSWVVSKLPQWLISGLVKSESRINISYWTECRKHTGISESSHFIENNYTGRKTNMLNAVFGLQNLVKEIYQRKESMEQRGVTGTWRNNSEESRLAKLGRKNDRIWKKAADRRRIQTSLPHNPSNPYDALIPLAEHVSSIHQSPVFSYSNLRAISPSSRAASPIPQPDDEDTIRVDSSVYAESMLASSSAYAESMPPPSSQAHGRQQKRHRREVSENSGALEEAQRKNQVLKQRLAEAKLRVENRELERQLAELGEDI